jgi:hypothetical protein
LSGIPLKNGKDAGQASMTEASGLKIFQDSYPAIYNHLKAMGQKKGKGKGLYHRDDQGDYWWELRDCDYYEEFEKEKIFVSEFGYSFCGAFDDTRKFCQDTAHIIIGNKYHLAILNSKVIHFYIGRIATGLGEKGIRFKPQFIQQLPIPKIPESAQQPFIALVDQILSDKTTPLIPLLIKEGSKGWLPPYQEGEFKDADTSALERQIDEMVYELYGLTEEEIEIVEGKEKV